jgi:carbon starvation protein CstA
MLLQEEALQQLLVGYPLTGRQNITTVRGGHLIQIPVIVTVIQARLFVHQTEAIRNKTGRAIGIMTIIPIRIAHGNAVRTRPTRHLEAVQVMVVALQEVILQVPVHQAATAEAEAEINSRTKKSLLYV